MFKNCGDSFHSLVVERGILPEMVRIVRKKTDMEVRDKILILLDSWQDAFGGPGGKYPQFFWAYTDLKRLGVEFPLNSGDASLIFTPSMHHTATPRLPQAGYGTPSNYPMRLDQEMASEKTNLSLYDLDRIKIVAELLNDMLKAMNSRDHKAIEDEVIIDLVDQCRSNQQKILQCIDSTRDEELLGEGLALNDNLQSLLAKHSATTFVFSVPYETSAYVQGPIIQPQANAAANMFEDEEKEDEEFSQLARRNSKIKPSSECASTESDDINKLASATVKINEITSSMRSNALALPDPRRPIKATIKEQNMTDLLSITLSLNPSQSYSPMTPSFQQNEPLETVIPYTSYAAPWAQPQPQYASYPPPPWEDAPSPPNAFSSRLNFVDPLVLREQDLELYPNHLFPPPINHLRI